MSATDLFTEILRWIVWVSAGIFVVSMVLVGIGTALMKTWKRSKRRRDLMDNAVIYDWAVDGGVSEPVAPVGIEDMYPRSHVSVPDTVPMEWVESWR